MGSTQLTYDVAATPVALLAGGLATRLRPITQTIPKAMVEVAGRPFIDHQLELLHEKGFRKVVMLVGYRGEMLADYLGDGSSRGMELSYCYDGEQLLGTGGALRKAAHLLGNMFWVMYGDSYMDIDYSDVLTHFASAPEALGLMTVIRNDNRWDRSNVIFENGRLIRYDKRSQTNAMKFIDYGVSILRRDALLWIPPEQPHDLANTYHELVERKRMIGHEVFQRFYEMGSPSGLEETRNYLQTRRIGA